MTNNNQNILCMCRTIVVDFEVKNLGFLRENNLNKLVKNLFVRY
jgi:hypothetical protein